jgi:hypothetical protein
MVIELAIFFSLCKLAGFGQPSNAPQANKFQWLSGNCKRARIFRSWSCTRKARWREKQCQFFFVPVIDKKERTPIAPSTAWPDAKGAAEEEEDEEDLNLGPWVAFGGFGVVALALGLLIFRRRAV